MHDNRTIAFDIRLPKFWKKKQPIYQGSKIVRRECLDLVIIYHIDPEKDGTDNSCDWHDCKLVKEEREEVMKVRTQGRERSSEGRNYFDIVFQSSNERDIESIFNQVWVHARKYYKPRPWWKHPRWHLHHWQIRIPVLQELYNYLFERCSICGKKYAWDEIRMTDWSCTKTWHFRCQRRVASTPSEEVIPVPQSSIKSTP